MSQLFIRYRSTSLSAIHYILKPIESEKLIEAVNRYNKQAYALGLNDKIDLLKLNLHNSEKRLMINSLKDTRIVKTSEILYCESSNNYTAFFLDDNSEIIVSKPLNYYYSFQDPKHTYSA